MTPAWILDILAALMLVVAAVSAGRLVAARPWQRGAVFTDTDVAHLLMAIAMAGTLASGLSTLPNAAWDVIFALLTAWFAVRVVRDARVNGVRALAGGHCAPHLVHSAAMLYMFLALLTPAAGGGAGMSGMGSAASAMQTLRYPTLAFVFALILLGYIIWDLDQLSGRRYGTTPARAPLTGVTAAVPALAAAGSPTAMFSAPRASALATAASTTGASADADVAGIPDADRPGTGSGARGLLLSPAVTVGCRIAMGVSMAFMLIIMI
jgi:Domain of unknown function (DUF5134)